MPFKVIQRKKSQPLSSWDIPQPSWQDEEEAESPTARISLHSWRWRSLGGGAWVWVHVQPPLLSSTLQVRERAAAVRPQLWAWESELPVLPEHYSLMGPCPWSAESLVPTQGGWAHEPQVHFLRVL